MLLVHFRSQLKQFSLSGFQFVARFQPSIIKAGQSSQITNKDSSELYRLVDI